MSRRPSDTTSLKPAQRGLTPCSRHRQGPTVTHWFTWRHLRCKVQVTPDYLGQGSTMLQLEVVAARDTPCPITTTGHLANFVDATELARSGGAVAFLTAWMNREAQAKAYQQAEFLWRQGDLLYGIGLEDESREA